MPKITTPAPTWRKRAWKWAEARGATARPWRDPQVWPHTLLYGSLAVLGGGLAQLLVSLVYAHARLWASGVARLDTTIQVQAGMRGSTISVHVELPPARHRCLLEWATAILAVVGEIAVLIFILFRLT